MKKKDIALDLRIKDKKEPKKVSIIDLNDHEKGIVTHLAQKGCTARTIVAEINEYKRLKNSQNRDTEYKPITVKEFSLFLDNNKDFRDELIFVEAKSDYVRSVEQALYELAIGATTWQDEYVSVSDGSENGSHLECVRNYKKDRPDFSAIKFILTNTAPMKWRDKVSVEVSEVEKLSDEDLAKMAEEFIKKKRK